IHVRYSLTLFCAYFVHYTLSLLPPSLLFPTRRSSDLSAVDGSTLVAVLRCRQSLHDGVLTLGRQVSEAEEFGEVTHCQTRCVTRSEEHTSELQSRVDRV